MTWLDLAVAALATWQAVEVWHHGSLFAGPRAALEVKSGFWARLLLCPFCLSVWVAVVAAVALDRGDRSPPWVDLGWVSRALTWALDQVLLALRAACYALAVARLANLGNDLTRGWCRTPNPRSRIGGDHGRGAEDNLQAG